MNHLWLWPIAGGGIGIANAVTRWKTVSLVSAGAGTGSLVLVVGGMLVRLGLVAGLLIAGLRHGIVPGMLAFGGLWVTRSAIVIWFSVKGSGMYQRVTGQIYR